MKNKYTKVSVTYKRAEQFPMGNGSTQTVNLGSAFIEECLIRPNKPTKSSNNLEYEIWANWNKLTIESKISNAVKRYVKDIGGIEPVYKIM